MSSWSNSIIYVHNEVSLIVILYHGYYYDKKFNKNMSIKNNF